MHFEHVKYQCYNYGNARAITNQKCITIFELLGIY
jgi:hypothetical protein